MMAQQHQMNEVMGSQFNQAEIEHQQQRMKMMELQEMEMMKAQQMAHMQEEMMKK